MKFVYELISQIVFSVICLVIGIASTLNPKFIWNITNKSITINDREPSISRKKRELIEIRVTGVMFIFAAIYLLLDYLIQ